MVRIMAQIPAVHMQWLWRGSLGQLIGMHPNEPSMELAGFYLKSVNRPSLPLDTPANVRNEMVHLPQLTVAGDKLMKSD